MSTIESIPRRPLPSIALPRSPEPSLRSSVLGASARLQDDPLDVVHLPQDRRLEFKRLSRRFAITSLDEADTYLNHSALGPRLIQCTEFVIDTSGRTLEQILGPTDNMTFRSCMTLFAHSTATNEVFEDALHRYFSGRYDQLTLDRL